MPVQYAVLVSCGTEGTDKVSLFRLFLDESFAADLNFKYKFLFQDNPVHTMLLVAEA